MSFDERVERGEDRSSNRTVGAACRRHHVNRSTHELTRPIGCRVFEEFRGCYIVARIRAGHSEPYARRLESRKVT